MFKFITDRANRSDRCDKGPNPSDPYKSKKLFNPLIAGSLAGGLGYVGTLPLDYLKQNLQSTNLDGKQAISAIKNNVAKNGVKTLFKGAMIGSASIVPQMAIKFSTNDWLNRNTKNNNFVNGFIAGYLDGSFLGPVLSVQSVLQMDNTKNFGYKEAIKTVRSRPMIPFTFPLAFRNGIYTSILFGGQKKLDVKPTFGNVVMASFALNIPAVVLCSPADVIRAKQIQYVTENKTNNPLTITKHIYQKDGVRGFYRGFGSLFTNFAIRFPMTFGLFSVISRIEKK